MKYTVIFHRTEEALVANIQDATQEYLAAAMELSRNKETHEIKVGWMGRGVSRTHHNSPVALSLAPIITRTIFLSCGLLSIFPAMLGQNTKYRQQL